ncbi:InlB B-repeat-containing protein [Ruminococcus bromii]|uniref:InlB B-repeat-containing protein n=1 Tax=Ruminococcus bromii TaxID=40518 RepID=UPI003AB7787C
MKTKISHLGRSTVSVILAVMMLLSTMLIGTVSTVNAVGADSSHTVHKGETLYLDLSSQTNAARVSFLENDYADGGKAYFDKLPDDKIVSVKLSQDLNFSTYERRLFSYFNSSEVNVNNDRYNNLPTAGQNMVVVEANGTSYHWDTYTPVADKVSLTASDTSVKVGKDVTLTATLGTLATGLNDANVTYTFEQKSGAIVTGTTDKNTYKFTPTKAGEYKFEVTASAKGHSPVKAETTVNVSAETRNVTFSITGGSGTVKLNDATVNNNEEKPVELNSPYTITVTPDADSYIKTFTVGGNDVEGNTYTGTVSTDVAVIVEFAKKPSYNVTVNTTQDGTVTVDHQTAYEGQKVTVTPKATTEGYTLGTITAKCGTDNKDVALTRNSDGTYTFSMPAGDVAIDATFRTKKDCTVTVSSENSELGTVTLDNSSDTLVKTVKEGETVTIKANPTGSNIFKSWSINGTYDIKDSKTTSDAEITIVVNSDITATASFTQAAPYQVAYGDNGVNKMSMYATERQGIYVSAEAINKDTTFTIFNSSTNQYAYSEGTNDYWINGDNPTPSIVKWVDSYGSTRKALNKYETAKYVIFDSVNQFITLSDTPEYSPKLTLYVKPGTVSYDKSAGTDNSKYALSSVAKGLTATTDSPCNTYSVSDGDNITITTKMSEEYKKLGYYVAAYCVNGVNYNASLSAEADTYQANITVSTDMAVKNSIEVTPIYYNKTIEANGDYITFYVNADEALKSWGNTLSVDPYCYSTKDGIVHFFEKYPGQPLVKDGQYYVTKISKYYYRNNNGTLEKTTDTVSGITLNNYYNDSVHVKLSPSGRNMQTYDFSDFVKLAEMENVKTIMFQNKFYNADSDDAVKNIDYAFSNGTAVKKLDNIADLDTNKKVNEWQKFTDYYGRDTDVLGNILSDSDKTQPCIYVISTGSHNTTTSQDCATKGEWATKWCVYDNSGKLITCGTPADFLDTNSEQYTALNNEEYRNKPVKISYEKGSKYGNGYSRSDGRWYYSALGQEFTSDVAIEYKGDDGKYTADTNTNTANTGFIGKTSGATATINDVTTASFSSVTDTAHLNIKVANGWRFDGWYINGNKIGDNYTDISTDILMSNSYNIVARVSKIPTGTLELNHTAYTGTDPAAHTGTGFYYISAVVKKANGSTVEFDETQGVISIDNFAETDELTITLKAKCHGDNTVYALYEGEAGGYTEIGPEDKDLRGLSEFTYSFTVPAGSLFKNGKLAVNALNYYTDIVKVGGTCDITYKYYDRFSVEGEGNMVSYVVRNVELSTEEITNGYIPTNETITKYAPRIDTMYVDTKWKLDVAGKVEKGKSQATVIATQTKKTCKVYHPELGEDGYYTEIADSTPYTVDYNSLLINPDDSFMLSTPEMTADGTKAFSYWNVYKADKNGSKTELVTKCYERNFGLRIMADYYIEPVYGKEVPSLTANINSPVMNREVYGDSASATDKVYVDLLTAFTSTVIPTFKENNTDLSVQCGVFVVRNNTNKLTEEERNQLVDAANNGKADTTSTILAKHRIKNEEALRTELDALVKNDEVKNNANSFYDIDGENVRVTKYVFNNDALTNKNRIDKVIRYTNNTANQNYIFSAYAYVIIRNADGSVNKVVISDPQYYNICYVGNKA